MDKPFVIGDFIVVDDYMGTVEYVGLKTTRIRSLGGEQIIFSNAELLKNRIRNFKRMQERRVVYEFGIAYETPIEQVEQIPLLVKQIITSNEAAIRFDRAHFKGYGESALLFEAVYFVLDPDFNKHMDIQQAINLALLREFRKRGVAFAYPSRTVFLNTAPQQTSSEKKGGTARVVVMNEASMTEHQADRNERAMESGSAPQRTLRTPD
jgi:small-conductance mechanosensitive channel